MKRLSINQRLSRAKSYEAKQATALDWADNWQKDHDNLIRKLERAVQTKDFDLLVSTIGQLKVVGQKRFAALPNVINNLLDYEGEDNKRKEDYL